MVSFAQFKMIGLSFDFITNSIYSSLTLSSLVDTNSLSIAVQFTWSICLDYAVFTMILFSGDCVLKLCIVHAYIAMFCSYA